MKKNQYLTLFAFVILLGLVVATSSTHAQSINTAGDSCVYLSGNVGWGTTSGDVTSVQSHLAATGYFNQQPTGYYGNITMNAVKNYQTAHGIEATGYVGPITRGAIQNESCGGTSTTGSTGSNVGYTANSVAPVCPSGYTCTLATTTGTIYCPVGMVCKPLVAGTGVTKTTTVYDPGNYRNLLNSQSSTQNTGVNMPPPSSTTALTGATATADQVLALTQTASTSSSTPALPGQLMYSTNINGQSVTKTDIANILNQLVAKAAASSGMTANAVPTGIVIASGNTVSGSAQTIKPICAQNQFLLSGMNTTINGGIAGPLYKGGCVDNVIPSAPSTIVLHGLTPVPANGSATPNPKITDPYCPTFSGTSVMDASGNAVNKDCIAGEANKHVPYTNPWTTQNNIPGVKLVGSPSSNVWSSSNFCKNIVSFNAAKKYSALLTAQGIPNDLMSAARVVINNYDFSLDTLEYQKFSYMTTNPANTGYFWNGKVKFAPGVAGVTADGTNVYDSSDWSNPQFQSIYQNYQFSISGGPDQPVGYGNLGMCMDNDYRSNLFGTEWASHYQTVLIFLKSRGFIN